MDNTKDTSQYKFDPLTGEPINRGNDDSAPAENNFDNNAGFNIKTDSTEIAETTNGAESTNNGSSNTGNGNNNGSYNTFASAQTPAPEEIKKWNWGAFVFSIYWGIGHKVYLPLLCLIPFFGFVWVFICGASGNKWAWEAGNYRDVQDFREKQESWNRAGFVAFWIEIAIVALYLIIFISVGCSAFNYGFNQGYGI